MSEISIQQMSVAFGKYIAGFRPGDEGWSHHDQQAFEAVEMQFPQFKSRDEAAADLLNKIGPAIEEADLDEVITDQCAQVASEINDGGRLEQLKFLMFERGYTEENIAGVLDLPKPEITPAGVYEFSRLEEVSQRLFGMSCKWVRLGKSNFEMLTHGDWVVSSHPSTGTVEGFGEVTVAAFTPGQLTLAGPWKNTAGLLSYPPGVTHLLDSDMSESDWNTLYVMMGEDEER